MSVIAFFQCCFSKSIVATTEQTLQQRMIGILRLYQNLARLLTTPGPACHRNFRATRTVDDVASLRWTSGQLIHVDDPRSRKETRSGTLRALVGLDCWQRPAGNEACSQTSSGALREAKE